MSAGTLPRVVPGVWLPARAGEARGERRTGLGDGRAIARPPLSDPLLAYPDVVDRGHVRRRTPLAKSSMVEDNRPGIRIIGPRSCWLPRVSESTAIDDAGRRSGETGGYGDSKGKRCWSMRWVFPVGEQCEARGM